MMNRFSSKWMVGPAVAAVLTASAITPRVGAAAPAGNMTNALRGVTVNFVNTEIVDVLKALATQTGSNIVAGPEVKGLITISLREVDLEHALQIVTRLNNLAYERVDGTYVVTTAARLKDMYPESVITEVYRLTNMKPETAVTALAKVSPSVLAAPQGSSMVVLSGDASDVKAAHTMLARMEGAGAEPDAERQTLVYELKYLNPVDASRTLATMAPDVLVSVGPARNFPGTGKFGSSTDGVVEITLPGGTSSNGSASTPGADVKDTKVDLTPGEETSTIVLSGYPAAVEHARALLEELDVAPRQVEITARIVDLSTGDALKLGLQYTPKPLDIIEKTDTNPKDANGNPNPFVNQAASSAGRILSFGQFARLPLGVGINPDFEQDLTTSKLLANPRVSTLDGRPARIFIGDKLTYVVGQSEDPTTHLVTYSTEKQDVGILLLSIPKALADGTILLEVHPTVSSLVSLDNYGSVVLPRISERSVDTTVRMRDGETIAIGGLIRDDEIKTMTQVPFLSKIPFFGELFKHRDNNKVHSDVTIFITTRIVNEKAM